MRNISEGQMASVEVYHATFKRAAKVRREYKEAGSWIRPVMFIQKIKAYQSSIILDEILRAGVWSKKHLQKIKYLLSASDIKYFNHICSKVLNSLQNRIAYNQKISKCLSSPCSLDIKTQWNTCYDVTFNLCCHLCIFYW